MDELYNQGQDTCNNCKSRVKTIYHCTVCDDFDLCCACKDKDGHSHNMEKLGFDLDDGSSPGDNSSSNTPAEAHKLSIQRSIQRLIHSFQCCDANCRLPSCQVMKRTIQHMKMCIPKTRGYCAICKQVIALCREHAKHCQEAKCRFMICRLFKHRFRQQRVHQQIQFVRRHMALMIGRRARAPVLNPTTPGGPPAIQGGPLTPHQSPGPMTGVGGGIMAAIPHQGIGMNAQMYTPPANVLQVVTQVQEGEARQQVPHPGVSYEVSPSMAGPLQPTQQSQAPVPQPVIPPPSRSMQLRSDTRRQENLRSI